jgi:hypothetical protein
MPQQNEYLSLDPNAGLDGYLSTDPNAGTADAPKSVGGFLSNVVESAKDTGKGILSMLNPRNWDDIAQAADAGKVEFAERAKREIEGGGGVGFDPSFARLRAQGQEIADEAYRNPVGMTASFLPVARPRINLQPVKAGAQAGGVRLMRGAVKAPTSEINKMAGASRAGLDAKSEQVAQTALREGVNPMTARGLETIQQRVENLGKVRDGDIAAAPQVPIAGSGQRQLTSLRPVVQRYRGSAQSTPQADLREIQMFARDLKANPDITTRGPGRTRPMRDLTPNELNQLNKGDNKALTGKFNKVGDAEIDARRAVIDQRRTEMESVVPGVKDTGKKMSELINLRNVANVARKRSEGRDGIGITDMIALGSGRPETLMLSTAMRPAVQAGIGGALHRTGAAVPSEIDLSGLFRLALMQQLASEPEGP